jgi:hypothetical protein
MDDRSAPAGIYAVWVKGSRLVVAAAAATGAMAAFDFPSALEAAAREADAIITKQIAIDRFAD